MCLVKMIFVGMDLVYGRDENPNVILKECKPNVDVIKNVRYFSHRDDKMDMYISKAKMDKYPVHIYIHGGGFLAGNKKYRRAIGYYLANESQNIVLNVEYGKSPKNTAIESINELKELFTFIDKNKDKYHFDTSKVSVSGDSSGAYFALYLSLLSTNKELQKEYNYDGTIKIYKTILNCGIYDYSTAKIKDGFDSIMDKIIKATTNMKPEELENYERKHLFKPLNFIDENTSEMLLCYCKYDFFCTGQSEQLIEVLDKYKIKHQDVVATTEEYDHCFSLTWGSEKAIEYNKAYAEYIK